METTADFKKFTAFTHYTSDQRGIQHEIIALRCEVAKALDGWTWAMYATIARCAAPGECPMCSVGQSIIRDRGESPKRARALAAAVDRVNLNFGRDGLAAATVKILPTHRARTGRVVAMQSLAA